MTHPLDRIGFTPKDREFVVASAVVALGLIWVLLIVLFVDSFLATGQTVVTRPPCDGSLSCVG